MKLSFRLMVSEDLPEISKLGLRSKASWNYEPDQMAIFAEEFQYDDSFLEKSIVAEVAISQNSGEMVGYFNLLDLDGGTIEVDYFFVCADHFKQGIGRKMMLEAVRRSIELGFRKMKLIAEPNAAGFYEKFGFRVVDEHQSSIPGRMIPIMEMPL